LGQYFDFVGGFLDFFHIRGLCRLCKEEGEKPNESEGKKEQDSFSKQIAVRFRHASPSEGWLEGSY
jgi:hypothetical protein